MKTDEVRDFKTEISPYGRLRREKKHSPASVLLVGMEFLYVDIFFIQSANINQNYFMQPKKDIFLFR